MTKQATTKVVSWTFYSTLLTFHNYYVCRINEILGTKQIKDRTLPQKNLTINKFMLTSQSSQELAL